MYAFVERGRWLRGLALAVLVLASAPVPAKDSVPTSTQVLGFEPGDDYKLASYEDSLRYFHALDASSARMMMVEAGTTTQGRRIEYAVISSPANLADWEKQKAISRRLADSRDLDDASAKKLAAESKVIVHIDGGLHSSEAMTHQTPLALAHRLLSAQGDPQVDFILDNVILVLWPTLNPDGQSMIADWYRQNVGTPHETSPMPWLYQEYVGHDNNRDGYMLNMVESRAVTRAAQDYSPAIFYTLHHKAPFPGRIWVPPFADPISGNVSPYMRVWTNLIGAHMLAAFEAEQKPGAMSQQRWDNWYPGYLDYTHVFRHTIAFFTETALHEYATPHFYAFEDFPAQAKARAMQPEIMHPSPWKGGWWRPRDAVDYQLTATMSALDTAARYRSTLQYNRYQSARDTITLYAGAGPQAWVIPAQQHDPGEAADLVQRLLWQQIEIYQARAPLTLDGRSYSAGSWVIPMQQPFARLVQELFERQKHPGKQGEPPHDTTGWTLPLQMGVDVQPVQTALPADKAGLVRVEKAGLPAARISGSATATTFLLDRARNDSYKALNRLLKAGAGAAFSDDGVSIVVTGVDRAQVQEVADAFALQVSAVEKAPLATPIQSARVGLYRPWKASMDEGWTRWLLEQYGYAPLSLYNADMRAGGLAAKVDVLIVPDMDYDWLLEGFKPEPSAAELVRQGGARVDPVPEKYLGGIGAEGVRALREFVAGGGTLVAFSDASDAVIRALELPVENLLRGVSAEDFNCSGSLLKVELASTPATGGLLPTSAVMFESSPVFAPKDGFQGTVLARYPQGENPLLSGIIHGDGLIRGKAAALQVEHGQGRVFLYGFRPQWRGQSHGTYKFVFNPLYTAR